MDTNPAEYGYDTHEDADRRIQPDPDVTRVERHRLALYDAIGAVADDIGLTDDGPRALAADVFNLVERYRTVERQQSGSGQQPPGDHLRQPAGRDADDPDTRGPTAGVPLERGTGEPGAMWPAKPDTKPIIAWLDYGEDDDHSHYRPYLHSHAHRHPLGRGVFSRGNHGHEHSDRDHHSL